MATAKTLIGSKFRLYVSDGTNAATRFDNGFVCLAVDKSMVRSTEFETTVKNDCDNPSAPAVEEATVKFLRAESTFGGTVSAKRFQILKALWENQTPREFMFWTDETALDGGEKETFFANIESLEEKSEKGGPVNFTCKLKVQGVPTRVSV